MNMFKRILAGAMVCALCLSGGTALAGSGQHEVTVKELNFRAKKSTKSEIIAELDQGTVVTVLDNERGWAKIRWNGRTGYVDEDYLKKIDGESKNGKNTTRLTGGGWMAKEATLYEAADTGSDKVATIDQGETLSLRGETLNFYYVKADGRYGYVRKSDVSMEPVRSGSKGESGSALQKGDESDAVRKMQKRLCKLGYLEEDNVTGYFGKITEKAVKHFQLRAGLDMDGVAGPATMKALNADGAPRKRDVIEMDWYDSDVSSLVKKRGGTAYIVDCETGIRLKIRRVGGSNHMDVEPARSSDTEKLSMIYGGEWTWDQRAVILIADGKYIAASINGMPHGDEISGDNDFDGQFCLHTTGSKTHGSSKVNGRHQDQIEEALEMFD